MNTDPQDLLSQITNTPSASIVRKVLACVDAGLVSGLGSPVPGQMCVEAAVCFAYGIPHGDEPPCVGSAVRSFKIALNDSAWSSNKARAAGMRRLAVAQLGSDALDQRAFSELLALRATQRLLPGALRDYAQYCYAEYQPKLEAIAKECEAAQNQAHTDASLARLARLASLAGLASLASLARLASLASLARLDRHDRLDSLDRHDRLDRLARLDKFLISVAELGEAVLVEMKSPGCEFLPLCEETEAARR